MWSEIGEKAALFGVSIDPVAKHRKFIDKYDLPFPLISDVSKESVEAYGFWMEMSMFGEKYMGTERTTFIIDKNGAISAIFAKVKPAAHLEQLLAELS